MHDLDSILAKLAHPRLLVVGDLILDRYTWGDVARISPEAPVMVLRADREEVRPGGAASVAALLRTLDAVVSLGGVIGDDGSGRVLAKLLNDDRIDLAAVLTDPGRPTTTKERLMGRAEGRHPQQMLRVDREETHALAPDLERRLVAAVMPQLDQLAAVLISDYAKGVCTPSLLRSVIDTATECGVPVFIDPARITDYARYRGAALLTPNRVEASLATGRKIAAPEDALAAAAELRDRLHIPAVLLKLDRDGMLLAADGDPQFFPTEPRDVCDVAGAGDLVLAILALARVSGLGWPDAVPLANLAAGLEVQRLGVAPVRRADLAAAIARRRPTKLLTADALAALADGYRRQSKTLVFTNGCFDLLHIGHADYLHEAASLGDVLIVAVNSDASVRRLKGPGRPVIGEADRAAMLAALACVAHVVIFDADTPEELLCRLRPDVLVKGGTYRVDEVVGRDIVEAYGGRVCVTSQRPGVSTTAILAAARRGE
jgi:D-beta-D-heptose 7-phosphate kinase/D-beta-D-heptose 1-phosphate adenosyltransferase